MKRAVIIGGAGFLGSHLTEALIGEGYSVCCVDRPGVNPDYVTGLGADFRTGDAMAAGEIEPFIGEDDVVFHLAAYLGKAPVSREQYYALNVDGAENVLRAAIKKKASKFVFPSSLAAVGPVGSPENPITEDSECRPVTLYGRTKLEAEQRIRQTAGDKITVVILRPPPFFGPRANPITAASLLFRKMGGKTMLIIGDTKNYFPLCFVGNLAWALIRLSEASTSGIHTYIISDDQPVTLNEILMLLREEIGTNKRIISFPYRLAYSVAWLLEKTGRLFRFEPNLTTDVVDGIAGSCYYYDISRAKQAGYSPRYTLREGIRLTVKQSS